LFLEVQIWHPKFVLKDSLFSVNFFYEPGLGAGINPGMALTPLPSSIGWDQTHDLLIVSRVLYR